MCGVISTDFPRLSVSSFESSLASDDVLAHYFNDFLSLPSFPEALLYNQETGLFEVASGAAECVSTAIRSVLCNSKSQLLTGDPTLLARMPPIDNHYTVCCLDREQGMQWIKRERLPFFLQSNCYYEYRLAKLLLQWDPNLCIHRRKSSSVRTTLSAPQLRCSLKKGFMSMHSVTHLTSLQKEHIIQKSSDSSRSYSSWSERENVCSFSPSSSSGFSSAHFKNGEIQELKNSQRELSLCFSGLSANAHKETCLNETSSQVSHSPQQLEYLAVQVTEQMLKDAVDVMDGQTQAHTFECFNKPGATDRSCECKVIQHSNREGMEGEKEGSKSGKRGCECDKKDWEVGSGGANQEDVLYICCHGTSCYSSRPVLDEFREFLQGTPGEKLLNLWMDIERLKATRDKERKNRYLVLMRGCYLLSSSQFSLNIELLSRLGLTTSPCWTEEKLCSVQACLTESLLHYWAPRFGTSRCRQEDQTNSPNVELGTELCYSLLLGSQLSCYSTTTTFPRTDTCLPQSSHTFRAQLLSSRGRLQCSRIMEKMLQALCVESHAGLYFTHFCEQSGNQLWVNAVYFWTDLQYYHELFYQDGLDPYRVQREAQLLYSTYVSSSAKRSIGIDEELRAEVYARLMPAFEELFDSVEEHTLNILVDPWTLMADRDGESFQQVCVQEEVRYVDSQEYRELRSLYEESQLHMKRAEQCSSMLPGPFITPSTRFLKDSRTSDSWSSVSPNYRGYRLGSLLCHRHEIGHFMSFLQNQNASIHLMCWLDLEQYRRTPQEEKAIRQERSMCIAARYLNRKYFFASDSPATAEQQSDILRLAGGAERLKLECLSNPVVVEIQDIVRTHIETTWLPLFLSTAEFTERQKHRVKAQAGGRLSQHVRHRRRARREAWKAEGLWMSSSKEILLFRQILLNPVTCQQFQDFVYSKGGFLENDVLFWLEVQRYKDLCHSHSDDATIEQKVSTIIGCFISSSMPPALQIDIPPEQAQHILEKRHELGPYIFREAQISVFNELLKFWPEFQELSSSIQEEQLIPLLQEKRVKYRDRVRRQRRKEEEEENNNERREAQDVMERQDPSFTDDDEEKDKDDDEEQEERSEKKQSRTQSRVLLTPTQTLSWSYSKYVAGLKREEVLLRRQSRLESTFSTASDSSSNCSIKSASSKHSYRQPSQRSSRTNSKQCNRYNSGVRA
ncbi:regulator of G-protein signaling 22 isoform X2 [Archocentrus centrarchus]|uniref:regulator of G-protein signaling 22 isoform X2 n=1 Tax=Archocentrus centrarchus TaxID=63155 RepID=UPI0011EA2D57|nr:regulator of G-protein signaling 22 isoform X2 [Archocentrus centrarchus]